MKRKVSPLNNKNKVEKAQEKPKEVLIEKPQFSGDASKMKNVLNDAVGMEGRPGSGYVRGLRRLEKVPPKNTNQVE